MRRRNDSESAEARYADGPIVLPRSRCVSQSAAGRNPPSDCEGMRTRSEHVQQRPTDFEVTAETQAVLPPAPTTPSAAEMFPSYRKISPPLPACRSNVLLPPTRRPADSGAPPPALHYQPLAGLID